MAIWGFSSLKLPLLCQLPLFWQEIGESHVLASTENRSDRLYALMEILKDGNLHRAEDLAAEMQVSLRTIYRDMQTLANSGVAIEGERGTGYRAKAVLTLPPMNLTEEELEALHIGLEVVGTGMEGPLRAAAESLSAKIDAVLPEEVGGISHGFGFAAYPFSETSHALQYLEPIRTAIRARQKLRITGENRVTRDVRPLKLDYWGRVWTLGVWDETLGKFAKIRVDQVADLSVLPGLFVEEPGKSLKDLLAQT
ncbi:MAG: HTH domain-containing protein [Shimia sp.]|nr:HTH domain-containing protein [Shimia sp.]